MRLRTLRGSLLHRPGNQSALIAPHPAGILREARQVKGAVAISPPSPGPWQEQAEPPRPDWPVQAVPREQETPAQAQPAPRFCGRRLLCRGGSSCLGANRGDTVGLGIDGEEEEPCTNVAAARLRKARMILFPAVRITAREAGTMI